MTIAHTLSPRIPFRLMSGLEWNFTVGAEGAPRDMKLNVEHERGLALDRDVVRRCEGPTAFGAGHPCGLVPCHGGIVSPWVPANRVRMEDAATFIREAVIGTELTSRRTEFREPDDGESAADPCLGPMWSGCAVGPEDRLGGVAHIRI